MSITWYNCFIPQEKKSFGFSVKDGRIDSKFPDNNIAGRSVSEQVVRNWFLQRNAEVIKVAVQEQ